MPNDLTIIEPTEVLAPLSKNQMVARVHLIHDVMKSVMKDGVDFGIIPGTPKPSLFKPGAEKLCVTFRFAPDDPIIEESISATGDIRYRARVPLHAYDGRIVAVGIGECSTGEEKYKWRRPVHDNEYTNAPVDQRREKYQRDGSVWKQVRVNPADVSNTVLKMAHKRAYVHGVIMATAAGSIFTQDIEDVPEGASADGPRPQAAPIATPQRRSGGDAAVISEPQAGRFYAIAKGAGHADGGKAWLIARGINSDREIPKAKYDEFCRDVAVREAGAEG